MKREPKNQGSGLGLYIAKLTAEELGGSISVKSQPGSGATFSIRLPASPETH
ncbi:MAG: ATP-binding protein [Pseudoflavonifractor sp.]